MNVTFEKKDDLNGTISVNISSADYLPEIEKQLKNYQHKVSMPGFRPGKTPKSMIEKMYGNTVLLEAVNTAASKGLFDYIEGNKLNILGQPVLSDDSKIDELSKDKDYTFKFDVGMAPDLKLDVTAKDVFTKYVVNISDKMVDEEVDRLKKRMGTMLDVEAAEDNDMVYCSFDELDAAGNTFEGGAHADNAPVLTSTLKNDAIKTQFIGIGKDKELTVNIFDLFENNETEISHVLGVQKIGVNDLGPNFKLVVKEIKRNVEAELDQDLFDKTYGPGVVSTVDELKAKIKEELNGYYTQQSDHLFEHELIDKLVAKHNIQLPDAFLKRWLIDRHADKFNAENVDHNYEHEAEYLRNHLFEEKLMAENGVKIEEQDIREAAINYTKSMFGAYGTAGLNDELLNSIIEPSLKKEDYRSKMINLAISNKVRTVAKSLITIDTKELESEEFFKTVSEHNAKHHHNHEN
ncbi:MAG: trigger factor [Bacteroidota bacterium]